MGDSGVALDGTLASGWPEGTTLIPLLLGRLTGNPGRDRQTPRALTGAVAFEADLLDPEYRSPAPSPAAYDPEGYLGYDVLSGLYLGQPWDGEGFPQRLTLLGADPGKRSLDAQEPVPGSIRTLHVVCDGPEEAAALRAFLDTRRGRLLPFWLPSWDEDLTLVADAGQGLDQLMISSPEDVGYHALVYPLGAPRRHVQLWAPGQAPSYHRITALEDWDSGVQEIDIDPVLPVSITTDWRVSFLRFCRLDTDAPRLEWDGDTVSCALPIREIPAECPE
jgi:hypothetical protein